jgi:hypothetical protein
MKYSTVEIWKAAYAMMVDKHCSFETEREVCITPFEGNYGVAGWVIVINGSPPRGILTVVGKDPESIRGMVMMDEWGNSKRIRPLESTSHLRKSAHASLWIATVNLLSEYTGISKAKGGMADIGHLVVVIGEDLEK